MFTGTVLDLLEWPGPAYRGLGAEGFDRTGPGGQGGAGLRPMPVTFHAPA